MPFCTADLCNQQYAQPVSKKGTKTAAVGEEGKKSNHVQRILTERKQGKKIVLLSRRLAQWCFSDAKIDPLLESQFAAGRLYASISSRPGQSGRSDGYILEGKELEVRLAP